MFETTVLSTLVNNNNNNNNNNNDDDDDDNKLYSSVRYFSYEANWGYYEINNI